MSSSNTRVRILLAAERLFAERGIDAVSLREIGAAAGQRNNSAVQYHFVDRTRLVQELLEYRLPPLNARRSELLKKLQQDGLENDLESLVEAHVVPLAECAVEGSWYVRFVARTVTYDDRSSFNVQLGDEYVGAIRDVERLIDRCLKPWPKWIRQLRHREMALYVLAVLSFIESRQNSGKNPYVAFDTHVRDVVRTAVALLRAPTTPSTGRRLRS